MDNSHSVTDNIYPSIDGISNTMEKDLPASKSTGIISDGDDDEKNLDQQEDSTDGIILSTNVLITFIPNIIVPTSVLIIIEIAVKGKVTVNIYFCCILFELLRNLSLSG